MRLTVLETIFRKLRNARVNSSNLKLEPNTFIFLKLCDAFILKLCDAKKQHNDRSFYLNTWLLITENGGVLSVSRLLQM